ncbi:glycosyltransferase family A protein [Roseateles sp.]|uniref:glycosyltransferase family 2 protein n=1 Tax=Roseateles sp. TaxID=1971397 RepID=UPI0025CE0215|nr:glycosyltransferase family A protein [Roseateles sp.]MBV8033894.1 glycosyltransferase family 2 protein [Roseateles sp.]
MSEVAPAWSVVVPVYNKAPYVEATLRSVLAQQCAGDFEIVVVDDGSRDGSAAIVQAMADPRIRLMIQANAGVSAARNNAVRQCRGEFVVFLDGDDLHHPECLSRLAALRRQFPVADMLAGGYVRVAHEDMASYRFEPLADVPGELMRDVPARFLQLGMPFFTSSIAVRRALFECLDVWFPEGENMGEDLDLWLRLAERGPVAYTAAPLAVYRVGRSDSLMGSYRDAVWLPVWRRLRQRALTGPMPSHLRSSSLRLAAEMEITLARRLARAGRRREAWRHLCMARAAARGHRWWITALGLSTGWKSLLNR